MARFIFQPLNLIFVLAISLVVISIALGGFTKVGLVQDAIIQVFSLLCIGVSGFLFCLGYRYNIERIFSIIIIAILTLFIVQLAPLPPTILSFIRTRNINLETAQLVGIIGEWGSITLSTNATLYALFSIIPAIAIFLMVNQILEKHIIYLLFSLMLLSVVNIIIGLQQIAVSGTINGSSVLSALSDHAVGFFINRNHFGAMNYASIPMATALILIGLNRVGAVRVGYIFSGSICTIIFIIGLSVTYSRASLAFGIIATMVSGCMIALRLLKSDRRALAKLVSLLFVTVIIALILFVFYALAEKRGLDDVRRLHISETTIDALWALLPLGSGFGTFVPIFMIYEPDMYLERYFMNHAHNDYLEIFLEGGLPSVMIMLVFLFWLGRSSIALWFSNRTYGDNVQIGRTATLSIALLMIHSLLDYPLRTTALISVAALLTALIMRACQHRESDGRTPSSEKW